MQIFLNLFSFYFHPNLFGPNTVYQALKCELGKPWLFSLNWPGNFLRGRTVSKKPKIYTNGSFDNAEQFSIDVSSEFVTCLRRVHFRGMTAEFFLCQLIFYRLCAHKFQRKVRFEV